MSNRITPPLDSCFQPTRRQLLQVGSSALAAAAWLPQAQARSNSRAAKSTIGMNLAGVNYYMSERPFNNLFLTASEPMAQIQGKKWGEGGTLQRDAQGWVTRYQPQQFSTFLIDLKQGHPRAAYRVSYRGSPRAIDVDGRPGNHMIKDQDRVRMMVRCYAPIRDVVVKEVINASQDVFAAPFVERCRQFTVLRFMDWQQTNRDEYRTWSERVTPEFRTQSEWGVALEYMIQLCNLTGSAMWYCAHHRASDEDLRQAARLIKSQLQPRIPVYLEHSNEVWNGGFPQHKFARQQDDEFYPYHVQRTATMARIWRAEGLELCSVLGLQAANTWLSQQVYKQGVPEDINAVAIAPYFGGEVGRGDDGERVLDGGPEYVIDAVAKDFDKVRQTIRQQKELAERAKLSLIAYEGGSHLVGVYPQLANERFNDILLIANRRPEMYDFFHRYLDIWDEETDHALMCLYHSVSTPSKYGSWGLMEYEGQSISAAHKYRAVLERLPAPDANA
jgi:hypothetical protein